MNERNEANNKAPPTPKRRTGKATCHPREEARTRTNPIQSPRHAANICIDLDAFACVSSLPLVNEHRPMPQGSKFAAR